MIEGFHRIVVFCSDTDVSKEWYQRAGFRYLRGYQGMHWFALGNAEIMLHPGGQPDRCSRPNVHVAVSNAREHFDSVVAAGLAPQDHQAPEGSEMTGPVERPWGEVEFELYDPDGQVWVFTQAG